MKLGLRAQICPQCQPGPNASDPSQLLAGCSCEVRCPLFIQLPRLARFLERYRAQPPAGYEEFAIKLLGESSADTSSGGRVLSDRGAEPGPFLDYATDALAILESVAALSDAPVVTTPEQDEAPPPQALEQTPSSKGDAG